MRLWEHISAWLAKNPGKYMRENDAGMTFEEVAVYAEALGGRLMGEKCCAIDCKSELAAAVALLSCFSAGVTAVPLAHRYGEKLCNRVLSLVDPTCVITDADGSLRGVRREKSA